MLTVPSAFRSYAELYRVSPIFELYTKAICARSSMLMAPSWFASGSLDTVQLALLVDTLTLHTTANHAGVDGIDRANLVVESEP